MDGWHKVSTLVELEQFLKVVGDFHDGILKEVHWTNRDHVDDSLSMSPFGLSDARVLVQRQWRSPSAVEMFFEGVWSLRLDTVDFIFGSSAREEPSSAQIGPRRALLVLDMESSTVAFERMRWRDVSGWMGPEPRFGSFAVSDPGP